MSGLGLSVSRVVPNEVMRDLTRDRVRLSSVRDLCRFMMLLDDAVLVRS